MTLARLVPSPGRWLPRSPLGEVLVLWAVCFGATLVSVLVSRSFAKVIATLAFLWLPLWAMRERNEDHRDYGLSLATWRVDLAWFLGVALAIFPAFIVGYVLFVRWLPELPPEWTRVFTPYRAAPSFAWRLPDRFWEWVIDHLFVVAIPEEFFYRGYLQHRLREAWPEGRTFLGARLGRAFWLTAVLFALGHLAVFEVWRLAVFFPALVFGWMRERTGSVVGAALLHGSANILIQVLDACYFPPP